MTLLSSLAGGGGGLVLLDTQLASNSASLDMVIGIDDTYDEYEVRFALVPASDNVTLCVRVSSDGGSTWDAGASDYRYKKERQRDGADGWDASNRNAAGNLISAVTNVGSATGEGVTGVIRSASLRDTTLRKLLYIETVNMSDVAESANQLAVGARISAAQFNGLQLFFSTGNVESGWARLYGVAK